MDILKNFILAGVIIILLFFLFIKLPEKKKEVSYWQEMYVELLDSKQDTIKIRDTIESERIVLKDRFLPIKSVDTVFITDTVTFNWYFEEYSDSLIQADFAIITHGFLKHFDFQYKIFKDTEYITSVVYRDVIKTIEEQKRSMYVNGAISSDLSALSVNLSYHTKKNISFNTGLLLHRNNTFFMFGVGYKIF